MDIRGKTAMVTGGASGLGLATAHELHAAGAKVVIADLARSDGAAVARRVGADVAFVPADITNESDVAEALDVAERLGPIRVLVNCAGASLTSRTVGRSGPFPLADFRRVVEVNLVGTFNALRLAAERMAAAEVLDGERGVIVNTASVSAFDGQIGQAAYSASKSGLVGLTLPVARDLAAMKIRMMTVAPGPFRTPPFEDLPEEIIDSLSAQTPHPARLGDPSEFAMLVRHIVENPMLNGEVIRLDGAIRVGYR